MKLFSIAALSAVVLAIGGVGAASAGLSALRATTVHVTAKDYSFKLSTKTVRHGRITFVIRNAGHAQHNLAIAGHRSKTISPGQTTRMTVTLKRGRYMYHCTVDDHTALGMHGVLHVT